MVGSGAAGISVALTAAARGLRVLVLTKDLVGGATPLAQGGLAAALGPGDTAAAHVSDTLTAGAGLCEPGVVAALADAAPGAIGWLTGLGARLETRDLRLEGGHSAHRIVHSGDDATGAEVHRTLLSALLASSAGSGIEILDRTIALELLPDDTDRTGVGAGARVAGGTAAANAGQANGTLAGVPASAPGVRGLAAAFIGADGGLTPGLIRARTVVIAAGGLGQAFGTTSNPAGATGDGIAIAARAGVVIRDLEFVQFHPTVLWLPGASGQCPLITEALRGAGAVLRELDGTPLMAGHDPRGDLAPRDVVAARMAEVIAAGEAGHVWLDATALGADLLENGFPTVTAACRKHGIDPVTEPIPVAPGAHYSCGGILADLDGRTSLPGLYAAGEAASTGVQGANRLASNSVTEAVIAGRRTGAALAAALQVELAAGEPAAVAAGEPDAAASGVSPTWGQLGAGGSTVTGRSAAGAAPVLVPAGRPVSGYPFAGGRGSASRRELAEAMSRWAGVLRDGDGLARLAGLLGGAGLEPEGDKTGLEPGGDGAEAEPGGDKTGLEPGRGGAGPSGDGAGLGEGASVRDDGSAGPGSDFDLEAVEAANLRTVSLLIAAGAGRRAESRGCHRRRDAAVTAAAPWHTLAWFDGRGLVVTEEEL
ncbi:MAG TPA: FAD-binding protein [Trebonia sp.]